MADILQMIVLKFVLSQFYYCSHGSKQRYTSIGSDMRWALNREQSIIWTNGLISLHLWKSINRSGRFIDIFYFSVLLCHKHVTNIIIVIDKHANVSRLSYWGGGIYFCNLPWTPNHRPVFLFEMLATIRWNEKVMLLALSLCIIGSSWDGEHLEIIFPAGSSFL